MWREEKLSINGILKTIGPGILYAGAAIGVSHLVFATQAGASYSFHLLWALVLINLFKYPFFEFAYRYTAATGGSLLEGYKKLGNWAITTFFILSFSTAIVNFAAVTKVTTALAIYLFHLKIDSFLSSLGLLGLILLMLFFGRYALLDKVMKLILFVLALFTVIAFAVAIFRYNPVSPEITVPDIWNYAGITFLIAFMGWMPTPIDASVWTSIWAIERKKQTNYTPTFREYKFDFHLGYIGSAVMAFFFMGLGALVMYGTGQQFSDNGVTFSQQLVSLYSSTMGGWITYVIAVIAFLTMLSTAITVIDGYPRSLGGSLVQMFPLNQKWEGKMYYFWTIFLSFCAAVILGMFTENMRTLLEFATIVSFIMAPVFAIFNFKVVTSKFFPADYKPPKWLKILSWAGIIFLIGFSFIYLYLIVFM